jgi:CMP-N-acetylneuraminic acid synthetase
MKGIKIIAVSAARGGSKGVSGKNVMMLGGKPLIA